MEVIDEKELWSIRYALQRSPIGIEGAYTRVSTNSIYYTGTPNLYRVEFDFSNQLALIGLVYVMGEQAWVWLDTLSLMTLIRVMINDALTEYNSTSNWRMRGV